MNASRLLMVLSLCFCVSEAMLAAEPVLLHCGKADVTLLNSSDIRSPFFVLTVRVLNGQVHYRYRMDGEYFEIRCETKSDGKKVVLLNHFCGGSGCADSNYGIVDSESGNQLLEPTAPSRGNADQASRLLGHPVKPFSCEQYSSTSSAVPDAEGEYCFRSPLELG